MPSGIPQHAASRAKNTARNASNTALPQAPFCCLCHPSRISSLVLPLPAVFLRGVWCGARAALVNHTVQLTVTRRLLSWASPPLGHTHLAFPGTSHAHTVSTRHLMPTHARCDASPGQIEKATR